MQNLFCSVWLIFISMITSRSIHVVTNGKIHFSLWLIFCFFSLFSIHLSILKEISPGCSLERLMFKLKLQCLATLCKVLTHLKSPWCWERLKRTGGQGDDRVWDGWMASLTQWTWVWLGSGSWCWTGRPGMLQLMGLQRVGHDWLNWTDWKRTTKLQVKENSTIP